MQRQVSMLISSIIVLVLSSCVLVPQSVTCAEPLARIIVDAGIYTRIDTPVSVSLEDMPEVVPGAAMYLVEIGPVSKQAPVPAQIAPGNPPQLWWILSGTTPAGGSRVYELVRGKPAEASFLVKTTKNDKALIVQRDDKKVLQYNYAIVPAPKDLGRVPEERRPLYDRSGFIHPLWSPAGAVLTDIHPADHIHHVGIWMPWTKTKFEGKEVDFWNLGKGEGTVRFVKFLSTTSGPVYGGFQAEQEHVALKTAKGEKVVLKETWDVRVYNLGGPEKGYWLWDFVSTQRCVADSPLYQIQYRYGGFGFRSAAEWKGENAAYLTSEGRTRKDGHATRARWCDTSGAIKGKWAGITHMSHPQNFRHPEPMRIWPEFENQVFFNWAPSQAGDWVMEPGKDYIFRYRLYVHEGKVNVDDAERLWHDYAEPPKVKIEKMPEENVIVLSGGKAK